MNRPKPLVLMILDGWGYSEASDHNAIAHAHTPYWDRLWETGHHTQISTSGESVGLPPGQMGNSEVGHMNIGAGRIVYQDFSRISQAIDSGEFKRNPVLCQAIDKAIAKGRTVHIMGLLSAGGVHSHEQHLYATVELAHQRGAQRIRVHAFLDGRDTPPRSAEASLQNLENLLQPLPDAATGVVSGRYYAMDRDQRWDRIQRAYRALTRGESEYRAESGLEALAQAYQRDESDEFVQPTVVGEYDGIQASDSVLFVNFRADRARQLSQAFVQSDFDGFSRGDRITLSAYVGMTEYLQGLPMNIAFPPQTLPKLLAEILATAGLQQLRIAETEKYAHVTFFFNGGREQPFAGETRLLIPSPKVATYDLQPEMSAPELTAALVDAIESDQYDVIICNVANPDMVGHSGNFAAAVKAVEAVDRCLGEVADALMIQGGEMLITADHGNVEQMLDTESGQAHTAHTVNPVPLLYLGRQAEMVSGGSLRDIAPTMLYLLDLPQPEEMTGRSLLNLTENRRSVA